MVVCEYVAIASNKVEDWFEPRIHLILWNIAVMLMTVPIEFLINNLKYVLLFCMNFNLNSKVPCN